MAHKFLSIADMISIEKDEYLASRAAFNSPYACVKVEPGESDSVLPQLAVVGWAIFSASRSLFRSSLGSQ